MNLFTSCLDTKVDDELKKIKNPKLMTVRQRALLERKGELQHEEIIKEELVALPTGKYFLKGSCVWRCGITDWVVSILRLQRNGDD